MQLAATSSNDVERSGPSPATWATALAPLVFLSALGLVNTVDSSTYDSLAREDGVLEYATAIAYGISTVLAAAIARRHLAADGVLAALYAVVGFGCLLVAGEEISWGQRLVGFDTPGAFSGNTQDEVSFHNFGFIQRRLLHPSYIAVGLIGGLGWTAVRGVRRPRSWAGRLQEVLPPARFTLYFLPVAVFYFANEIANPWTQNPALHQIRRLAGTTDRGLRENLLSWKHQEPVEFLMSVGVVLFLATQLAGGRRRATPRRWAVGGRPAGSLQGTTGAVGSTPNLSDGEPGS